MRELWDGMAALLIALLLKSMSQAGQDDFGRRVVLYLRESGVTIERGATDAGR